VKCYVGSVLVTCIMSVCSQIGLWVGMQLVRFAGTLPVLWVLKTSVLVPKNWIRDAHHPVFFLIITYVTPNNAQKHSDFPKVGENIHRGTTAIN
jgi:hypothetical protein